VRKPIQKVATEEMKKERIVLNKVKVMRWKMLRLTQNHVGSE
jgi:hypothetical protein